MTTQAYLNNIRFLVGTDDLATALRQLQQLLKDSPQLVNEAILQSARYSKVLKQVRLGLTDTSASDTTTNQIRKGILDLLNEIETQEENKTELEKSEAVYEYQKIKDKIFLNRGAGTSELLNDKKARDLDEKELARFFQLERVVRSFDEEDLIMEDLSVQQRLVHLGIAENGHIFKGTFLCLGKRNQIQTISHSATESQFIFFKGTERVNILVLETLSGHIVRQYERMMMLLRVHIPLGRDREKSEDIYEIPMAAIKEFITNAFIHRTYDQSVQSYIQVELFDDRLEIKSPGHLPFNVDVNKIEGTVLTNPTIAAIFHLYKHIERAGTGINSAQKSLEKQGLQRAVIENINNPKMVKVTISRKLSTAKQDAEEAAFWQEALQKNTLSMYTRYLRNYPNGKYANEVDKRLGEIGKQ